MSRKSIFITGAASGMGRATALKFAREGWLVGAYDVDTGGLQSLLAEIGDGHVSGHLDVTDRAAYAAALDRFGEATGGTLDLHFNNAGIGTGGLFDEQPWDEVMRIVNVNFLGVMLGIQLAVPLLKATPGALCLINSSSSAIWGTAGIAVYSATKHAVRGLTEALSIEFKRFGVRVSDLLPGLIDTPLLGEPLRSHAPAEGMWRMTPPSEVADTAWRAYHEDRVHWYVPEELKAFDLEAVEQPERVREERVPMFELIHLQG